MGSCLVFQLEYECVIHDLRTNVHNSAYFSHGIHCDIPHSHNIIYTQRKQKDGLDFIDSANSYLT